MLRKNILFTVLLTFSCLAREYDVTPPAQEYSPYRNLMTQYMMLSHPSYSNTSLQSPYNTSSSYVPDYSTQTPSAPPLVEEDVVADESVPSSVSPSPYALSEKPSWWSGWQERETHPVTTTPLLYDQPILDEREEKPIEEIKPTFAAQKLDLIPAVQATEDKRDPDIYDQLKKLQEQNKILLELVKCNTEQLQIISEVLGVKFEQSEKNQEEILTTTAALQQRMMHLKKYVESHQSSTWYTLYQCGQTGLQLSKAVGGATLTFKTLSLLPAFVIPGWAVYVSTLAAGSAIYFLRL